jgi:hypothetical protein
MMKTSYFALTHSFTFLPAWMEFTETESPQLVQRPPQIVLVARDLDGRTDAALSYLTENDLPVTVLKVTTYQDTKGRRFIEAGNFRIINRGVRDSKPFGPEPELRCRDTQQQRSTLEMTQSVDETPPECRMCGAVTIPSPARPLTVGGGLPTWDCITCNGPVAIRWTPTMNMHAEFLDKGWNMGRKYWFWQTKRRREVDEMVERMLANDVEEEAYGEKMSKLRAGTTEP